MGPPWQHRLIVYLLLTGVHGNGTPTTPPSHSVWPSGSGHQVTDTNKNTHEHGNTPNEQRFPTTDTPNERRFPAAQKPNEQRVLTTETSDTQCAPSYVTPDKQCFPGNTQDAARRPISSPQLHVAVTESNDGNDGSASPDVTDGAPLVTPDFTHAAADLFEFPSDALSFGLSLCSLSCEAQCNTSPPLPYGGCFCHRDCELYGDCCLDYYIYCKEPISVNDTSLTLDEFDQLTKQQKEHLTLSLRLKNYYEWSLTQRETPPCEQITTRSTQNPIESVQLTTQCPEDVSPELAQYTPYCEDPSLVENVLERNSLVFRDSIPTLAPALAFKNQYCAKCNGVFTNNTLVKVNNPDFNCGNETKLAERLLREEGYSSFAQFLMQNCTPIYKPITEYHLKCLVLPIRYIDSCNKSLADVLHQYNQLEEACESYRTYVLVNETHLSRAVVYRNPHCALCNGHNDLLTFTCFNTNYFAEWLQAISERTGTVGLPSFSLLVNFKGDYQATVFNGFTLCPAGSYLDFRKNTCNQNKCSPGKVMLQGNCSRLQLNPVLSVDMRKTYSILVQIENVTGAQDMAVPFFTYIFQLPDLSLPLALNVWLDTGCSVLQDLAHVHGPQNRSGTGTTEGPLSDLCVIAEVFKDGLFEQSTLKTMESVFHAAYITRSISKISRDHLLQFVRQNGYTSKSIIIQEIHLLNYRPPRQFWNVCEEHKWITSQERTVFLAEKNTGPDGSPPSLAVHWSEFDLTLSLEEFPALLSWARPNVRRSISHWPVSILSSNCLPDIFTCEQVMLQTSDVVVESAGRIKVKGHAEAIGPELYALGDDEVFICRDILENAMLARSSSASDVEGWLTLCGITLSLVGLFITLVTYCTFPALRTRPGLAIMNLCFALFIAQVLFEISPAVADGQKANVFCIVVGSLQHYSWLAAFFWMNVLAFDAALTFGAKTIDTQQKAVSSKFRAYLLYGWGVPAAIVSSCVLFDLVGMRSFDYIDPHLCWLEPGQTLFIAFGAPLAVLVFLNVTFFLKTAISLKKTMSQTQTATQKSPGGTIYKTYVKLFSIMGLSWILGFVSVATDLRWVTYGFIVVNSLQGVFICLSFGLTSRTRQMYQAKLTLLHQKINKSSTTHSSLEQSATRTRSPGSVSATLHEETPPADQMKL